MAQTAPVVDSTAQVVTSSTPVSTNVTIYRGQDRRLFRDELNLEWLQGYALITETRDVTIPAGHSTIRFEGVAGGMLPESAIVAGLPSGVREKNLDADLLSPRNLYARSFGRPVTLRRKQPHGAITEERAIIRSAPDGAVIVETAKGFEAANCGPLNDQLAYHAVPDGLFARPTLSIETDAPVASHVRLSLSYLAWGFDWQASYILNMRPDGHHADMTGWVSLASSDTTSFIDASAAVVGGKPNFDEERGDQPDADATLVFHCYLHPPAPVPAPQNTYGNGGYDGEIIVTAQRRTENLMDAPVTVKGENLGDLKLLRIPVPTTVAAHAQKQVALFDHRLVTLDVVYQSDIKNDNEDQAAIVVRTRNRKVAGLGLALPAGQVIVSEPHEGRMIRVGTGGVADKAIGEMIEVHVARSPQVHVSGEETGRGATWEEHAVTVTNANPWPIHFEGRLRLDDDERIASSSSPLTPKDGTSWWLVTIPANGRTVLHYRLEDK